MTSENLPALDALADRINTEHAACHSAMQTGLEHAIEAGRLLIEAKAECPHGDWLPFLEMAGVHERQARRLMQLARSGLKADTVSENPVPAHLRFLEANDPA